MNAWSLLSVKHVRNLVASSNVLYMPHISSPTPYGPFSESTTRTRLNVCLICQKACGAFESKRTCSLPLSYRMYYSIVLDTARTPTDPKNGFWAFQIGCKQISMALPGLHDILIWIYSALNQYSQWPLSERTLGVEGGWDRHLVASNVVDRYGSALQPRGITMHFLGVPLPSCYRRKYKTNFRYRKFFWPKTSMPNMHTIAAGLVASQTLVEHFFHCNNPRPLLWPFTFAHVCNHKLYKAASGYLKKLQPTGENDLHVNQKERDQKILTLT